MKRDSVSSIRGDSMSDRGIFIGLAFAAVGLITAGVVSASVLSGANPNDDRTQSDDAPSAATVSTVEPTPVAPSPSASAPADESPSYGRGEVKFNDAFAPYTVDDAWWVFVNWCTYDRNMYYESEWPGPGYEEQVEFLQVVAALLGYDPGPIDGEWSNATEAALFSAYADLKGITDSGASATAPRMGWRVWGPLTRAACWSVNSEDQEVSFDSLVASWPNGMALIRSGVTIDPTSTPTPTPTPTRAAGPTPAEENYELWRLWNSSGVEFQEYQCQLWRADSNGYMFNGVIAVSGFSSPAVVRFMNQAC
jgi:hypothetical protein